MAQKFDRDERVGSREVIAANSIEADALIVLMIYKDFVTKDAYFTKLKQVWIYRFFDMDHNEIAECPACGNKITEDDLESM